METKATVKMIGEKKSGVSNSTGNPWQRKSLLLEWIDSEGTHRVWGNLFNQEVDDFDQQGFKAGDEAMVRLIFTSRSFASGFVSNNVEIEEINKINQ